MSGVTVSRKLYCKCGALFTMEELVSSALLCEMCACFLGERPKDTTDGPIAPDDGWKVEE